MATKAEIRTASNVLTSSTLASGDKFPVLDVSASGSGAVAAITAAELAAYAAASAQPLDATLTALAGQNWAADSLPVGSGSDTVAQVTFSANTFPARASTGNLVAKAITDASLTQLAAGLGTASVKDTGTSGATVPLLNGANTWSAAQTVVAASAAGKPLVVQGAASQTASLAEFQSSTGTAYVTVGPPTLSGSSATSNFLNITGTLPSTLSDTCKAVNLQITTAGSSAQQIDGLEVRLLPGYTGSSETYGMLLVNVAAGTGASFGGYVGNFGLYCLSSPTTTGHNVGMAGRADSGSVNVGVYARATTAKNSATNVGAFGIGRNTGTSPIQVGGYFGLDSTTPTFASAALMCDNSDQTSNIFVARDNGTAVFTIADGGGITLADAVNVAVGTSTGTKIGTATSQKLGFFNATPVVQPTGTTDLRTALINLGLYASGGATPLDLNGGAFTGYYASTNAQTGTTYTLAASDAGKVVTLSNASAITLTLPNSLSAGFVCTVIQKGAGQVTFSAAGGATLRNRSSQTKTAGQYAVCTLYVDSNSGGSAADYYLAGDTGA